MERERWKRGDDVRNMEIYVIELRGVIQIMGLMPGVHLVDLGYREDRQQAILHALDLARLLGVPEHRLHLFGQTINELLEAGLASSATFSAPYGLERAIVQKEGSEEPC